MTATDAPAAPARGFDAAEYQERLSKAQKAMMRDQLGAVLLSTEAELYYFSGFLTQFWQSPTRPWFVVLPLHGKAIAVIPEIGVNCMKSNFLGEIVSWSSPHESDDGVSLLATVLLEVVSQACEEHGDRFRAIGLNKGCETHLRMPLQDFDSLRGQLAAGAPDLQFKDATHIMRATRMIKSEAEIEKIHYVAQCASDVFENVYSFVQTGMRDDEIFRAFKIACLQAGVDDVSYLVGAAGPGGYDDIISPPSGKVLQDGDVLMLDTGCTYDGYFCDFDRNYGFGTVADDARRAHEIVWQATEAGLAVARPGNTCADIFRAMDAVMQKGGALGESVGRYGHGLGIQLTEPPSHTAWDTTVLQAGMVLTLEPGMIFAPGRMMVHEENIVVREEGPHLLSRRAPEEMPLS